MVNNRENIKENLKKAKAKLEVYTDIYNHFEFILENNYHGDEYKAELENLFNAFITNIDPLNY